MIKKALIIEWVSLPEEMRKNTKERLWSFCNDVVLRAHSEFDHNWAELSHESIKQYHEDQTNNNNYTGTLEEFIEYNNLKLEVWLIENHAEELKEVDEVFIDVCW
jgi:hypothetical protein